jgi:hypothetical protein
VTSRLAPGSTFAGYRIDGVVGRGGMGVVYRAWDVALERPVALKVIVPELAEDVRFRERFLRESRIAAAIEHPHILPVHAAGEEDGVLFLVMRFMDGEDLRTLLEREGRLDPDRATALLTQVAGALDAAHGKGLVHRDVKPGNVLIASSGEAYLCDFGLSKPAMSDTGLTKSGEFMGTLDYVAPEQIQAGPVDGRADQYSLACVLFECVVGRPPFHEEGAQPLQMMWAHVQQKAPSLVAERPDLGAELDTVLTRGLSKTPEERYGSCGELLAAALATFGGHAVAAGPGPQGHGFVGRDRELGELLAGLDHALAGRGRLFLIGGEPGIGKSRLAGELVNRARARGARVLIGRCWEAGGAPAYWPWVQALRSYVRDSEPLRLRAELGAGAPTWRRCSPRYESSSRTCHRRASNRTARAFAFSTRPPRF